MVNLTRQEKCASVFDAQDKQRRPLGGFSADALLYSVRRYKPLRLMLSTVFLTKYKASLRWLLLIRDYSKVKPVGFTKLPFTSAICLTVPVIRANASLDPATHDSPASKNITNLK